MTRPLGPPGERSLTFPSAAQRPAVVPDPCAQLPAPRTTSHPTEPPPSGLLFSIFRGRHSADKTVSPSCLESSGVVGSFGGVLACRHGDGGGTDDQCRAVFATARIFACWLLVVGCWLLAGDVEVRFFSATGFVGEMQRVGWLACSVSKTSHIAAPQHPLHICTLIASKKRRDVQTPVQDPGVSATCGKQVHYNYI